MIIIVFKVTHARYKFRLRKRKSFAMGKLNDTDDERWKERKFMEEISLLHSIVNCNLQQSRYDYNDMRCLLLHKKTQYDEDFSLVHAVFYPSGKIHERSSPESLRKTSDVHFQSLKNTWKPRCFQMGHLMEQPVQGFFHGLAFKFNHKTYET